MRLAEKTIIVTGASSGLGKAMAKAFVSEGANVVCASRSKDRLATVVDEISEGASGRAIAIPTNVHSWDEVHAMVEKTVEKFGRLDVVLNNAGVTQLNMNEEPEYLPVAEMPIEVWDGIIDTNLRGVFLCSKAALQEMLPQGAGRLIHISSGHGVSGRANRSPYVASKFGLEGFHESLALELEGTGVETITLRPPSGGVYTERKGKYGRPQEDFPNKSPNVIAESSIQLAAGEGTNGGRYQANTDGQGYVEYSK